MQQNRQTLEFHVPGIDRPVELHEDASVRYRQLVCWCLVQRYRYYVLCDAKASDTEYDTIESQVLSLEKLGNTNQYSPAVVVGSACLEDYPRSVRSWCENMPV